MDKEKQFPVLLVEEAALLERTCTIYEIIDPRSIKCAYLGRTINVLNRFNAHLAPSGQYAVTRAQLSSWLTKLAQKNLTPMFKVLEEVAASLGPQTEAKWRRIYKEAGIRLVNEKQGGGAPYPATQIKAISENLADYISAEEIAAKRNVDIEELEQVIRTLKIFTYMVPNRNNVKWIWQYDLSRVFKALDRL